jgi:hypothetical protein
MENQRYLSKISEQPENNIIEESLQSSNWPNLDNKISFSNT